MWGVVVAKIGDKNGTQNEIKNEITKKKKWGSVKLKFISNSKIDEYNYTCAASRNTADRIMVIRAKHTTIV